MSREGAVEFELRFQVPAAALAAVERAFAGARTETIELHAIYFDTADGRLARVEELAAEGGGTLTTPLLPGLGIDVRVAAPRSTLPVCVQAAASRAADAIHPMSAKRIKRTPSKLMP